MSHGLNQGSSQANPFGRYPHFLEAPQQRRSCMNVQQFLSFSSAFTLMRLRAKTAWFWLHATTAILTVRCPQRYFHGDQRRI
ncbi:hypothetical protein TNCV_3546441 [Trichonephila clavipes]|nr:hypothetical protein TNCV_3546441 [Trichonephila clavipes]